MKISEKLLLTGATAATAGLLGAQEPDPNATHGDPFTPVGYLRVTPTVVQPGVQPLMKWGIEYPKSVPDMVMVDSGGGMTVLNDSTDKVVIRVAGVAYDDTDGTDLEVALWVRVDSGTWTLVYYGTETDVDAGTPVFTQTVTTGTRIDLAARGRTTGGGWSETQWTLNSSSNVDAVIDGDSFPSESSASTTGDYESFVTQYVTGTNEIDTGPRDVLHFFEVGTNDPSSSSFDMQDIVVVTTWIQSNNGHGNNTDGVDMSNPGGSDGTAGSTETDPYLDDEKKYIKEVTTTTTTTTSG